jgi:NAD(P)-dependent dehydrogenase (short-subunit alcohol dehydrogenase family)
MTGRYGLAGLKAVVTGVSSGIGAGAAARLRAEGVAVFGVAREAPADLVIDVAAAGAAEAIVGAAITAMGGIDILVANAGVSGFVPLEGHPDAAWDEMIAINLSSVFRLCRAALPWLTASRQGRIITTGSVMSDHGDAGMAAYAASKHGVLGLTRSLATELGPAGITVNCIQPGAILTGITAPAFAAMPEFETLWRSKAPLGRIGTPDDIAGVIAFLASDDARFISGHGIVVDGGAMAHP